MATAKPRFHAPSAIRKHSVTLHGHKTSVTVEDDFWASLTEIAERRRVTIASLIEAIDRDRLSTNLSSGIRLFVLNEVRASGSNRPATDTTDNRPSSCTRAE